MLNLAYLSSGSYGHISKMKTKIETMFKDSNGRLSSKQNQCVSLLKMRTLNIVLVIAAYLLIESATGSVVPRPQEDKQAEVQRTISQIRKSGFEVRIYNIPTVENDGPSINLYRIINPLADKHTLNRHPVLYGHGLLFDAYSMISKSEHARPRKPVIGEPTIYHESGEQPNDYSLPFMMSNNNFDVWLYDARAASSYMSEVEHLKNFKQARRYWNFTLDTEALEDLPLVMNFVLEKAQAEKIVYVGYSESTTFMFALLSTRPEIADKLAAFVALAPVTYISYMHGFELTLMLPPALLTPDSFSYIPPTALEFSNSVIKTVCQKKNVKLRFVCQKLMDSLGVNGETLDDEKFLDHLFHLTSLSALRQYAQILVKNRFAMYDYGRKKNMKHYGQPNPPIYNLTKIKSDRMIFARGGQDKLGTPESQRRLLSELGSKPYLDLFVEEYGHFSYVDGKDLIVRVNEPVMRAVYALLHKEGTENMTKDLTFSFEPEDIR